MSFIGDPHCCSRLLENYLIQIHPRIIKKMMIKRKYRLRNQYPFETKKVTGEIIKLKLKSPLRPKKGYWESSLVVWILGTPLRFGAGNAEGTILVQLAGKCLLCRNSGNEKGRVKGFSTWCLLSVGQFTCTYTLRDLTGWVKKLIFLLDVPAEYHC